LLTFIGGFIVSIIGLLLILMVVVSVVVGYVKNVNDYEERKRNRSVYDADRQ